jgi:hypothetical protein
MRLKSEIWVKAYLRRCTVHGAMAAVLRHGDDDAGAIFIKIVRLDRTATVFAPAPAGMDAADFDRRWVAGLKGRWVSEVEADGVLNREAGFDGDVWIVEVEDRDGRHFLGDDLVK